MNPLDRRVRAVRARYAEAPTACRAYVLARLLTCPLGAVADRLPPRGRLLDVGCGSGAFAHLAMQRGLSVVGVDPDPRKVAWARASVRPEDPVEVRLGPLADAVPPEERYDAVSLIDVLYLLTPPDQLRLLDAAGDRLAPGGRLLVKTMHDASRLRSGWARAQERVAVRGLGYTHGEAVHLPDVAALRRHLEARGLPVAAYRIDRGYLHPHLLLVADAP
ncbi:MAG: class I SAM-dependent methyltransferase [Rhodothermales bacterium]|nr:class I SAM-dependent methyltransferase [Rhodothermales bacterium]